MPVTPWASDATYSPPAAAGADQSTKIDPSAGERAQGFIPGTHIPIQWLNFVLHELGVLANTNETDVAAALARGLQAVYDQSVANAETSPHILAGASGLEIRNASGGCIDVTGGAAIPAVEMGRGLYVENGLDVADTASFGGAVSALATLTATGLLRALANAQVDGTLTASAAQVDNALNVDGAFTATDAATVSGLLTASANLQVDGNANIDGTLTLDGNVVPFVNGGSMGVAPSAASGTGASTGDVSDGKASYTRIGDRVAFSLSLTLDCTGYAATGYQFQFPLPVATNIIDVYDVQATAQAGTEATIVEAYGDASTDTLEVAFTLGSVPAEIDIHVSGHYIVQA